MIRTYPAWLLVAVLLFNSIASLGQRVLYSPYIRTKFEICGKAGDFYWTEERETVKLDKPDPQPGDTAVATSFAVYDVRMNPVNLTDPLVLPPSIVKEYLICGPQYFDQLLLAVTGGKSNLVLNRFTPDGIASAQRSVVLSLPFGEAANSFLLARSQDASKILLLCFEYGARRLHAILFDANWKQLSYRIYRNPFSAQPFLQDDFTNYPVEYFDNSPLQLTNSGQWLMMMPSKENTNYSLYDFNAGDTSFYYREIKAPVYAVFEDVALSVDNERGEVMAGVISSFRYPTLKNVEVVHYSLLKHQIEFDSSYRFNTQMGYKVSDENIIHENFVALPGTGFMLLKEYGKQYITTLENEEYNSSRVLKFFFTSNSITSMLKSPSLNKNGYTRFDRLGGSRKSFQRGDLCMFYFPARKGDSCWSGIINKEQTTEFNLPLLSYLAIPLPDKLFLLYNSFYHGDTRYGNSTILDYKGHAQNGEGLIYWKFDNLLNFQKVRRIAPNEMVLPYENNNRFGFASIKF